MIAHLTHKRPMEAFTTNPRFRTPVQRVGLPVALAVVQIVLAYEWFISGINKLVNLNFTVQLADTLRQSMNGNPYGAYVTFVRDVVLPHASLFDLLTELGETAIGVTLAISAVLWIWWPSNRMTARAAVAACFALAGVAFLSLNYFLQGGSPLPWINPANAFNEGVDIDILIPLLAVTLLVANLGAARRVTSHQSAAPGLNEEPMPWAS